MSRSCHREELQASQKEIDELKGKLRMKNSLLSADPDADINLAAGLCIKCAQNEAVLAPSSGGTMRESLEKVSRFVLSHAYAGLCVKYVTGCIN